MEGKKKITDQQTVGETCNDYFVAIAENVKRQRKSNFINDDNNNSVDNHIHFIEQAFVNLNQAWKVNTHQQKKLKEI